jgi:hypothetical protein
MLKLTLQREEAEALESILDALLISGTISDGAQKRSIRRVSMKIHWAKQNAGETAAA